jgi:hypothetical protein
VRGAVTLIERWPNRIFPLPAGSVYATQDRIVQAGPEPPSRVVLR